MYRVEYTNSDEKTPRGLLRGVAKAVRVLMGQYIGGRPIVRKTHAGLDEARAGNVAMGAGLRPTTKGVEKPPDPKVRAPALDPTGSRSMGKHTGCKAGRCALCLL